MMYVRELRTYDLLFCCAARGNVAISSNNLLLYNDREQGRRDVNAKKKAWNTFIEALKERYNEIEKTKG